MPVALSMEVVAMPGAFVVAATTGKAVGLAAVGRAVTATSEVDAAAIEAATAVEAAATAAAAATEPVFCQENRTMRGSGGQSPCRKLFRRAAQRRKTNERKKRTNNRRRNYPSKAP